MEKNRNLEKFVELDDSLYLDFVQFNCLTHNLSPLASKIYSYLIFDFKGEGVCFDHFVDLFSVSKSSVSSSIQTLLERKLVCDRHISDERKRNFILNNDYLSVRFQELVNRLETERSLIEKLSVRFSETNNEPNLKLELCEKLFSDNIIRIKKTIKEITN